jgi:adhesin transport system membrane fusion protein
MSDVNFKKLSSELSGRVGWSGSLILFVVLALVASLIFWSTIAELDNVTRGEGRVISSAQNQSVQAGEGGVILRRYVSENSSVSEGDILFEIDPIEAQSELNQMLKRLSALEVREQRLRSEIAGEKSFKVTQSPKRNGAGSGPF